MLRDSQLARASKKEGKNKDALFLKLVLREGR
jgi:hypothetical protein